jgi:hypothetical protein
MGAKAPPFAASPFFFSGELACRDSQNVRQVQGPVLGTRIARTSPPQPSSGCEHELKLGFWFISQNHSSGSWLSDARSCRERHFWHWWHCAQISFGLPSFCVSALRFFAPSFLTIELYQYCILWTESGELQDYSSSNPGFCLLPITLN